MCIYFFFFNDTATTEIYTLSLHDALPISSSATLVLTLNLPTAPVFTSAALRSGHFERGLPFEIVVAGDRISSGSVDRKSTRLNSSHSQISYAVFCLKKKKT